ncbi:MAG: PLP-dependent aminotransferase family protein [Lachnospiraceae bacterium]|nr:PLP-dependent aminotransferase family protein [Lachnospiraceae bacterium]
MLTYSFENRGSDSLYEFLYKQIKNDILAYRLSPDEKLPSKRALAKHLNVSTITVENAYQQLMAEGYIYSRPKSGFYVAHVSASKKAEQNPPVWNHAGEINPDCFYADFVNNSTSTSSFPFTTWTKLMRETMSDDADSLMVRSPSTGVLKLRQAIAAYLFQFRGMAVEPEQIIVGAGTEYLYGLIIQLLGRNHTYAVEDPGYQKITKIYQANNVNCISIPLDENGIDVDYLNKTKADIVHISPSHHFPTGIVTPVSRRYELLSWASKASGRYIIEDDYDSEFRLLGKPIPSLQSIDVLEKVIYINTFSKSLTSTIRISYMVLPKSLMERYKEELNFYSCTVSNFEQYTLARFIEQGHFEKHINRMRNYYRTQRDAIISCIKQHPYYDRVTIKEENAGLHFLLEVNTKLTDQELIEKAGANGIHISCLSEYYYSHQKARPHTLVLNYSGIEQEKIGRAIELLFSSF